jgi:hypothetical protein
MPSLKSIHFNCPLVDTGFPEPLQKHSPPEQVTGGQYNRGGLGNKRRDSTLGLTVQNTDSGLLQYQLLELWCTAHIEQESEHGRAIFFGCGDSNVPKDWLEEDHERNFGG